MSVFYKKNELKDIQVGSGSGLSGLKPHDVKIMAGNGSKALKVWPPDVPIWDDFERSNFADEKHWKKFGTYSFPHISGGKAYTTSSQSKAYWDTQYGSDDMRVGAVVGKVGAGNAATLHLGVNKSVNDADFYSYVYLDFSKNSWESGWRDAGNGNYHVNKARGNWSLSVGDVVEVQRVGTTVTIMINGVYQGKWSGTQPARGNTKRYVAITVKDSSPWFDEFWADETITPIIPKSELVMTATRSSAGKVDITGIPEWATYLEIYYLAAGGSGGNGNGSTAVAGSGGGAGKWKALRIAVADMRSDPYVYFRGGGGARPSGMSASGKAGGDCYLRAHSDGSMSDVADGGAGGKGAGAGTTKGQSTGSISAYGRTLSGGTGGSYNDNANGGSGWFPGAGGGGGAGWIFGTYYYGGTGADGKAWIYARNS